MPPDSRRLRWGCSRATNTNPAAAKTKKQFFADDIKWTFLLKPFYIQDHLTFTLVNYNHFISVNAQPAAGPLEDFSSKTKNSGGARALQAIAV